MRNRMLRVFAMLLTATSYLCACGGSHASLPATPGAALTTQRVHARSIGSVAGDLVAIDTGGAAAGGFAADEDVVPSGTWTSVSTKAIDTQAVGDPAPQAVYQSMRVGSAFTYVIPGLVAGASYTLVLSFAETFWTAPGQRVFNVSANGAPALTNFDIVAAAGAAETAVTRSLDVTAAANGTLSIGFSAITDRAAVSAIEVRANGPTPEPSSSAIPPGSTLIDAGGPAAGTFAADEDFRPNGTWTYSSTKAVNTSGVTDPAPQAVYESQRAGASTVTYTIAQLTPGAAYTVRLDFAELYFTRSGQRIFNVSINNATVLANFDIVAVAGAPFNAVAQTFSAGASAAGTIVIELSAVVNDPAINGIEVMPVGAAIASPTPSPSSFNDYPTFGYDNARDIYNPNSAALTPANVAKLHLAWQSAVGDYNTQTQPILAAGIPGHSGMLFVGGGSGKFYGYDALTGKLVWKTVLGNASVPDCGSGSVAGIAGTAAYDSASQSLYVAGNANGIALYHLDAATGAILGHVTIEPPPVAAGESEIAHTAVALNNGIAYVGIGSYCDASPWRGSIVRINVPALTVAAQYFPLWDPQNSRGGGAQPWSGGSIWGWGGVALDTGGNVLTGVGNGDDGTYGTLPAPFTAAPHEWSGLAETLLELDPALGGAIASHHPIPVDVFGGNSVDLDVQGTPLVFTPLGAGCGPMVAIQAKSGTLSLYDEDRLSSGPVAQYHMAPSAWSDSYLGGPTYSAATGLLYADVSSSTTPSLFSPGIIAIDPACGSPSVVWNSAFGVDSSALGLARSVPAVSAGGVVFAGTVVGKGGAIWAIDAGAGTVLNGATPVLQTSANLRMPVTIDGQWVFVIDNRGNLYGLTVDPDFPAIAVRAGANSGSLHAWKPALHN